MALLYRIRNVTRRTTRGCCATSVPHICKIRSRMWRKFVPLRDDAANQQPGRSLKRLQLLCAFKTTRLAERDECFTPHSPALILIESYPANWESLSESRPDIQTTVPHAPVVAVLTAVPHHSTVHRETHLALLHVIRLGCTCTTIAIFFKALYGWHEPLRG